MCVRPSGLLISIYLVQLLPRSSYWYPLGVCSTFGSSDIYPTDRPPNATREEKEEEILSSSLRYRYGQASLSQTGDMLRLALPLRTIDPHVRPRRRAMTNGAASMACTLEPCLVLPPTEKRMMMIRREHKTNKTTQATYRDTLE